MKKNIVGILVSIIFLHVTLYAVDLYQFSTINALMKGLYQGTVSVKQLKGKVDIGVGCGVGLGEVIICDGKYYLADANGNLKEMDDAGMMPFLTAAKMLNKVKIHVEGVKDIKALENIIESKTPGNNIFYAIEIKGTFNSISARSEDIDQPPYHPLMDWMKTHEHRFKSENTDAVIVGFKAPQFINGIGVGGYHFHYVTDDLKKGGHVLDMDIKDASVEIETIYNMQLILPRNDEYINADLTSSASSIDAQIKKVETGR